MAKWKRTVTVLHTVAAFGREAQCSVCHFCSIETYMFSIARSRGVLYVKPANCWLPVLWGVTAVSCVVVVFCLFVCLFVIFMTHAPIPCGVDRENLQIRRQEKVGQSVLGWLVSDEACRKSLEGVVDTPRPPTQQGIFISFCQHICLLLCRLLSPVCFLSPWPLHNLQHTDLCTEIDC